MMNFEKFKEVVVAEIKNYLPPEFENADVSIQRVNKTDSSYDGLIVRKPKQTIAPTVNLDACYERFNGNNKEQIMSEIAGVITAEVPSYTRGIDLNNYDEVKTKLFLKLSNYEYKKEFFDTLPHRLIEDLVVTYHIMIENGPDGIASATINNSMQELLGVTEEELYKDALISAPNVLPAVSSKLGAMFDCSYSPNVTVVTNASQMNGASAILYPNFMNLVTEGEKVYIIPSSIHEVLVYHDKDADVDALHSMVCDVNSSIVAEEERLSNHVYFYENGELKIAK